MTGSGEEATELTQQRQVGREAGDRLLLQTRRRSGRQGRDILRLVHRWRGDRHDHPP